MLSTGHTWTQHRYVMTHLRNTSLNLINTTVLIIPVGPKADLDWGKIRFISRLVRTCTVSFTFGVAEQKSTPAVLTQKDVGDVDEG